jgi:hypothetical protein
MNFKQYVKESLSISLLKPTKRSREHQQSINRGINRSKQNWVPYSRRTKAAHPIIKLMIDNNLNEYNLKNIRDVFSLAKAYNHNIEKEQKDFVKSLMRTPFFLIKRGNTYKVIRKK